MSERKRTANDEELNTELQFTDYESYSEACKTATMYFADAEVGDWDYSNARMALILTTDDAAFLTGLFQKCGLGNKFKEVTV